MFFVPSARAKDENQVALEPLNPTGFPRYVATASGPNWSRMALSRVAMSSVASAQVARRYSPSTRRSGHLSLRGWYTTSAAERPLEQNSRQEYGFCLSGPIRMMRPSRTVTSMPQRASQMRQNVDATDSIPASSEDRLTIAPDASQQEPEADSLPRPRAS